MSKKLFIIIGDSGDGSNFLRYSLSAEDVLELHERYDAGTADEGYRSGDGLQVRVLTVPEDSTYELLGIPEYSVLDLSDEEE